MKTEVMRYFSPTQYIRYTIFQYQPLNFMRILQIDDLFITTTPLFKDHISTSFCVFKPFLDRKTKLFQRAIEVEGGHIWCDSSFYRTQSHWIHELVLLQMGRSLLRNQMTFDYL